YLAIIYKPSGLLSVPYPGSRSKTAQDLLEANMRKRGIWKKGHRPFAVHRLDRDTSGILMFALSYTAQQKIMKRWHSIVSKRLYRAVCETPQGKIVKKLTPEGLIDAPLALNAYHQSYVPGTTSKRTQSSSYKKQGKKGVRTQELIPARTFYKIIEQGNRYTLFELALDTGKKNQIRAHLAYLGYPIAGDTTYRAKTNPFNRLALHAHTLEFMHPYTEETMCFEAAEPANWIKTVLR
ncbi:MAG TPA: RluA family pseudouridine synthase, partial [Treponemataceae bacterium]|nr:RluA family pseudouridine synthase [Treponemataceae bacterium]